MQLLLDFVRKSIYNYIRNKESKKQRSKDMVATMTKGSIPMESKKISISAKRQITIPQKFFKTLGFGKEAECVVRGNELIIRPVKEQSSGEFAEQILADLISQGYSGNELLEKFKQTQKQVRPVVQNILEEAKKVASSETEYFTYDDVFGTEDTI